MRDNLEGPIATEANTLPPTRSDADRKEAMLVDQFRADPQRACRPSRRCSPKLPMCGPRARTARSRNPKAGENRHDRRA
jgi:hypothetical protein